MLFILIVVFYNVMLSVVILSAINAERHCAEYRLRWVSHSYAECSYAENRYAECHRAYKHSSLLRPKRIMTLAVI